MPRRRVYILNIEDYLGEVEPAHASRFWPAIRRALFAAAIVGNGVLLVRLVALCFPDDAAQTVLPSAIGYAMIILLFISLAKRINHHSSS